MKRAYKGEAGYIAYERFRRVLVTAVLFAIPLAAFLTAYFMTGTKSNIITVVAMVGCIPACMSAVSAIMVYTIRSIPRDLYDRIRTHTDGLYMAYDLYLTNGDKNVLLDAVAVCGRTVVALTTFKNPDLKEGEKHMANMIRSGGLAATVNLMKDPDKFIERLDSLSAHASELREGIARVPDERYPEEAPEEQILHVLKNVSL